MKSKSKIPSVIRSRRDLVSTSPRDSLAADDLRIRRILRMVGGSIELAAVRAELAFTVRPTR
jgi:hypothetical protein